MIRHPRYSPSPLAGEGRGEGYPRRSLTPHPPAFGGPLPLPQGERESRSVIMLDRSNAALSQIHAQIMWSRLIAVVEEQAQTLVRTAFSTSVREAGDLSAGVFDAEGHMLSFAGSRPSRLSFCLLRMVEPYIDASP